MTCQTMSNDGRLMSPAAVCRRLCSTLSSRRRGSSQPATHSGLAQQGAVNLLSVYYGTGTSADESESSWKRYHRRRR